MSGNGFSSFNSPSGSLSYSNEYNVQKFSPITYGSGCILIKQIISNNVSIKSIVIDDISISPNINEYTNLYFTKSFKIGFTASTSSSVSVNYSTYYNYYLY